MGVTSPYTNIPNEEGISIVFRTLENENKPPIPTRFLREMLRLFILKKKKKKNLSISTRKSLGTQNRNGNKNGIIFC